MKPTLECNDCGWQGSKWEPVPHFDGLDPELCPSCGSDKVWEIEETGGKDGRTVRTHRAEHPEPQSLHTDRTSEEERVDGEKSEED